MSSRSVLIGFAATALFLTAPEPGLAQQASEPDIFAPLPDASLPQDPATNQSPALKTQKPAAQKKALVAGQKAVKVESNPAAQPGNDIEQRMGQLEAQIADMQVVVGTFESVTRGRGGATQLPAAGIGEPPAGGDADVRIGRLESQMQSLGSQLNELSNQVRALNGRLGAANSGVKQQNPPATNGQQGALPQIPGQPPAKQSALTAALGEQAANADTGFGQTIVTPGNGQDQAGGPATNANGIAQSTTPDGAASGTQIAGLGQQAEVPQPPPANPQDAYDLAYGRVLQQDYAGAELAFRDYLNRFPQTPLASNAQYWLGQSYYARGQYKPAAEAFLKGYKNYHNGQKAADSLLKVAMSLSRLGQKEPACTAFNALETEFPNASAQIKHLARSEKDRSGCQPAG